MRSRVVVVALLASCSPPSSSVHTEAPAAAAPPRAEARAPVAAAPAAAPAGPPRARTVDVTETHFGITVSDPYRWMEGKDNPEATAWLRAQGAWTRAYLALIPGREALLARVRELGNATREVRRAVIEGGKLFYFETAAGDQVAKLVMRDGAAAHVLVDPEALQSDAGHVSVDGFAASPDGRLLAYNVAAGGTERGVTHVRDIATGRDLPDRVERIWAGGQVTWLPDGKGFFYTQYAVPVPGVDPMLNKELRLHLLGAGAGDDVPILGMGTPHEGVTLAPIDAGYAFTSPGSRWLVVHFGGARSSVRVVIAPLSAVERRGTRNIPWQTVADYADDVVEFAVHDERLYLLSQKGASNRRLLSVPLAHPELAAARIDIPEDPEATIVDLAAAKDALYIVKMIGGRSRLLRWPWRGQPAPIALPFDGSIDALVGAPERAGVLFSEQGWTRPPAYFTYDPRAQRVEPAGIETRTTADFAGIVADEVEATSSDGTRVPLSILHRADIAHDGARPAIVGGYGGYGASRTPVFMPTRLAWLERGGVEAVCHVRGGGEKGHAWYLDGARERKMNGIHDLEACAQALIDARLSSPAHLFAQGRSMGGVLIGRAITDRPDLFAAANIAVGVVNPLRLAAAQNGVTQIPELGDPETEPGFRAIHEMDPYQHVVPGMYPATIFTIGLNDPRVSPWMTGKMAARMQSQTASGKPVAIRVEDDAGHGPGSKRDQVFTELADVWSFFLAASGDPAFQPR